MLLRKIGWEFFVSFFPQILPILLKYIDFKNTLTRKYEVTIETKSALLVVTFMAYIFGLTIEKISIKLKWMIETKNLI